MDPSLCEAWGRSSGLSLGYGHRSEGNTAAVDPLRAEKGEASSPTLSISQSWLARWIYTKGRALPLVRSWVGKARPRHGYLSFSTWFRISSTSWNALDRGERNTSTARRFLCQGDTEDFTNICWI